MPFSQPQRLQDLPPYLFIETDRKLAAALAAGKDVINFGIGDPDQPTPDSVITRMEQAVREPQHHRYPAGRGDLGFRKQIAAFFRDRYGVSLDPRDEILVLIGSKEGLGHLPLATVNPGETVLIPDPAYPVYRAASILAGGRPWLMRLRESNAWLPDLDAIPADVARSATLMFLNYPNNPTGAVAPRSLYERAVEFARRNDLIIAQDAAYNELYLSDRRPLSILDTPGAKDVAIEFHSASKTFNMTGWRVGFAVGNPQILAALAHLKENLDSGVFGAIQAAACGAFTDVDRPDIRQGRETYARRAEILCAGLRAAGFHAEQPRATFYVWARVPAGYDAMTAAGRLLDAVDVVCIPGVGFGEGGEGYVRFALTVSEERTREAVERLKTIHW